MSQILQNSHVRNGIKAWPSMLPIVLYRRAFLKSICKWLTQNLFYWLSFCKFNCALIKLVYAIFFLFWEESSCIFLLQPNHGVARHRYNFWDPLKFFFLKQVLFSFFFFFSWWFGTFVASLSFFCIWAKIGTPARFCNRASFWNLPNFVDGQF